MTKFLPEWVAPDGEITRPTASEINELAPQQQTVTVAGYNEPVPFVYGLQQVGGPIIAGPVSLLSNRSLVFAVALCRSGARRIESVDAVMINGVDQGSMPDINASPTIVSKEGISFRIYNGTQTQEDSTLKAALGAGFDDYFPETAYVVITVPVAQANDFNIASSIIWTIKGRRCFDPRTSTYIWTENPSLHLSDFVTCQKYGLDRDIIGVEDCADWNDSLYKGLPRARTGLVLNEALEEHQVLDLMSTYAECLWSYEGRAIRIIADAPVDAPVAIIHKDQIREGTVVISGANQANFPTALSIIFSDRDRSAEWGSVPAHVQSSDHEIYGSIGTQSDLRLLGVYRRVEAERRAWSRFMRLQVPGKISFQMLDDGVSLQSGDVVKLPDYLGLKGVVVRIISRPEPIDIGVYQIHSEIYRDDFYPESGDGIVPPSGVMFLFAGSELPSVGYEYIEAGTNMPIRGGETTGLKPQSGQIPSGTININFQSTGNHTGPTDIQGPSIDATQSATPPYKDPVPQGLNFGSNSAGAHSHSASLSVAGGGSSAIEKQTFTLAKKTQITSRYLPVGALVLSASSLATEGFVQESRGVDVIISTSNNVAKVASSRFGSISSSQSGEHTHGTPTGGYFFSRGNDDIVFSASSKSGRHVHTYSYNREQTLRSKRILAYRVINSEALLPKGAILGWGDDPIPLGWALCDGSNGTPDLMDFFISFTTDRDKSGTLLSAENKYTVSVPAGQSSYIGDHNHRVNSRIRGRLSPDSWMSSHGTTMGGHTHAIWGGSRSFAYIPPHYSIRFIQYIGE